MSVASFFYAFFGAIDDSVGRSETYGGQPSFDFGRINGRLAGQVTGRDRLLDRILVAVPSPMFIRSTLSFFFVRTGEGFCFLFIFLLPSI